MGETNHSHTTEERVSRLEATVETFVHTVSKDIQDQNANINALRQAIQEQGTPKWQNYIATAAVLVGIFSLIGSAYIRDLGKAEDDIDQLNEWRDEYTADHAAKSSAYHQRIKSLERDVYYGGGGDDAPKPWEDE